MIAFLRRMLPLFEAPTRRRLMLAMTAMLVLAVFEAVALVALAPLMQILTAPGLHPNSRLVNVTSHLLGNPRPIHLALILGLTALAIYVVKDVSAVFVMRWAMGMCFTEEARMVRRLMHLYMHGPYREHLKTNTAEFVRTLTGDVRQIFAAGMVAGFSALGDIFSVFFVAAILLVADPAVAITAFVYFGTVAIIYQRVLRKVVTEGARRVHEKQAVDFRIVHQSLTAIKEIKVRGKEDYYSDEVFSLRGDLAHSYRTMALTSITPRYVMELAMVGATATIAAISYSTEPITSATATLGFFLAGGFRLLAPLNKVMFGISQARASVPAANQVIADFEQFASPEASAGVPDRVVADGVVAGRQSPRLARDFSLQPAEATSRPASPGLSTPGQRPTPERLEVPVRFEDVWFSYTPGEPVVKGMSFEIHPGEAIGLVGSSGAGKSTVLDLLLGLLVPDKGRVLLGDADLQSVLRSWQRLVGYVPQDISLFDDTVKANVALGVPPGEIDEGRLWLALAQAQLDQAVRLLPEGADTFIGEAGIKLSGGQRQRLGVARALYHQPGVLMFDEATSALDNETEFKLTEILETLRSELTTVTIAHRLSTVRRCDRVLYLDCGELVAAGGFAELNERIPGFARLVELSDLKLKA